MKPAESKGIIKDVVSRGYVLINDTYFPPNSPEVKRYLLETSTSAGKGTKSLRGLKTKPTISGWIDDHRNIKNKQVKKDMFMMLVALELGADVWPEFFFDTVRKYRFDYCIPTWCNSTNLKIAIEVEGGIHMKGKSGHSSGTGIQRDMDKSSLANVQGWTLIRRTPAQLITSETIDMIRAAIDRIVSQNIPVSNINNNF